jgi:hypothetical protein
MSYDCVQAARDPEGIDEGEVKIAGAGVRYSGFGEKKEALPYRGVYIVTVPHPSLGALLTAAEDLRFLR